MLKFYVKTSKTAEDESYQHLINQNDGESLIETMYRGVEAVMTLYDNETITEVTMEIVQE